MEHTFVITKVVIIKGNYKDTIFMSVRGTNPFPGISDGVDIDPEFSIVTKAGYAEDWLKSNKIICKIEVIDVE